MPSASTGMPQIVRGGERGGGGRSAAGVWTATPSVAFRTALDAAAAAALAALAAVALAGGASATAPSKPLLLLLLLPPLNPLVAAGASVGFALTTGGTAVLAFEDEDSAGSMGAVMGTVLGGGGLWGAIPAAMASTSMDALAIRGCGLVFGSGLGASMGRSGRLGFSDKNVELIGRPDGDTCADDKRDVSRAPKSQPGSMPSGRCALFEAQMPAGATLAARTAIGRAAEAGVGMLDGGGGGLAGTGM
jgi:hypothetical protein